MRPRRKSVSGKRACERRWRGASAGEWFARLLGSERKFAHRHTGVAMPTQYTRLYPPVAWGCGAKSLFLCAAVIGSPGVGRLAHCRILDSMLGGGAVCWSSRFHVFGIVA